MAVQIKIQNQVQVKSKKKLEDEKIIKYNYTHCLRIIYFIFIIVHHCVLLNLYIICMLISSRWTSCTTRNHTLLLVFPQHDVKTLLYPVTQNRSLKPGKKISGSNLIKRMHPIKFSGKYLSSLASTRKPMSNTTFPNVSTCSKYPFLAKKLKL